MPLEIIRSPEHSRPRSLGWLAVRWIEHFCLYGPGDIQGTPLDIGQPGAIPLADELVELTVDVYALAEDGRRLYDSAFYSRPKGADKSGHAGRIALFEALGPCRFAGFAKGGERFEWMDFRYVYEPGEPMGAQVTYPFIRILATEEEQAGNIYDTVFFNCSEGPLREAFRRKDDVGLTRIYLPGGGEVRPSTASNAAKDGGLETHVAYDETHLYITPELKRMHATTRRNLTKRMESEPWSFEVSTMYAPGQNSIAELSHKRAQDIRDGKIRIPRAYFNHRQAPPGVDLADESALRAALAEAYGDAASYTDFDRKVSEIYDPVNLVDDSLRYYLNMVTAHSESWLSLDDWDLLERPGFVPEDGSAITLGLYGTVTGDGPALIGSDVETGQLFKIAVWSPAQYEGEVPRELVDIALRAAFARWDVVGCYVAREGWAGNIDIWESSLGANLCVAFSRRHPMQYDLTGRQAEEEGDALVGKKSIVQAAEDFRAVILDGARIVRGLDPELRAAVIASLPLTHDGDTELRQHVANARRRPIGGQGLTFGKEYRDSPLVVEAVKAAVLARQCRQDYIALPEDKKRQKTGSVYDDRGVRRL